MAFEELKQKQSVMWGSGPYQGVSDHLAPAQDHLMRAIEPAHPPRPSGIRSQPSTARPRRSPIRSMTSAGRH